MTREFDHARLLYDILPAVYRERDADGDLNKFLNGCGLLLDQMHRTLGQRYADIFPDADASWPLDSQNWLLPYLANLLDVNMVSPHENGKREEIAHAIDWRKAKGTLAVAEAIAEAVGGSEAVAHEGWKRVATTARVGMPLLPLESFGYPGQAPKARHAPMRARHPGLPAGTVDLRCQASAVKAGKNNPAARISNVNGTRYRWRQSSLHGAQKCREDHSVLPVDAREADWLPGYFDDPSVRTVDFRNPTWRQGYFHPGRLLLYTATHHGFFSKVPATRRFQWRDDLFADPEFTALVEVHQQGPRLTFRNRSLDTAHFEPIIIRLRVRLGQAPSGPGPARPSVWRFEGFIFSHTIEVDSGRLELDHCAALSVETNSKDVVEPVLIARDTLLKRIRAAKGLVMLQYVTVLTTTIAKRLHASDCIFNGRIRKNNLSDSLPGTGCIRYSAIDQAQEAGLLKLFQTRWIKAVFNTQQFGKSGCGVLHPATPAEIAAGAEDGGEMGAYHHLFLAARRAAVIRKLSDFLPTGILPVVIPDRSLHDLPGKIADDE